MIRKHCAIKYVNFDGKYWRGGKSCGGKTIRSVGKTARLCAKRLNFMCKKAGYPLPNPKLGFAPPRQDPRGSGTNSNRIKSKSSRFFNVTKQKLGYCGSKTVK